MEEVSILRLSPKGSVQVDADNFSRVKEALVRKYQNANLNVQGHATYLRLRCLKQIWDCKEILASLQELQPEEVQVNFFLGKRVSS